MGLLTRWEQGELQVYLDRVGDPGGTWAARGKIRVRTEADGRVTALAVPDPSDWSRRRLILADLVAQTLGVHRDEAIDALSRIVF